MPCITGVTTLIVCDLKCVICAQFDHSISSHQILSSLHRHTQMLHSVQKHDIFSWANLSISLQTMLHLPQWRELLLHNYHRTWNYKLNVTSWTQLLRLLHFLPDLPHFLQFVQHFSIGHISKVCMAQPQMIKQINWLRKVHFRLSALILFVIHSRKEIICSFEDERDVLLNIVGRLLSVVYI